MPEHTKAERKKRQSIAKKTPLRKLPKPGKARLSLNSDSSSMFASERFANAAMNKMIKLDRAGTTSPFMRGVEKTLTLGAINRTLEATDKVKKRLNKKRK